MDLFDAEVWTVPFFSHHRRHWFLGVVNFQWHQLQYLDSLPLSSNDPIGSHGPQFVFRVSDVFWLTIRVNTKPIRIVVTEACEPHVGIYTSEHWKLRLERVEYGYRYHVYHPITLHSGMPS